MAAVEIFRLLGSIFVDNEPANKSIDATDKKASGLAGKLGSMIGTAAKWSAGLVAAGGAVVGGMMALVNKTAQAADQIDKLSERTGIHREELQRWKYAADQSGADVGKLEVGIKKLSDVMDGAMSGSKANAQAFADLDVALKNTDGSVRSTEAVFEDVMRALADMEPGARRNALGNDLLGKSYTEMLPLLNAGADGMEELKKRADELGLVISEDAVKANVKFGDTMADLKAAFGAVFVHVSNMFLPVMQKLIDWILLHMPEIQRVISWAFGVIATAIESVVKWFDQHLLPVLDAFWAWLEPRLPAIQRMFETVFKAVWTVIERVWQIFADYFLPILQALWKWIEPHLPAIQKAVEVSFGAIAKAVQIVLDVFEGLARAIKTAWDWLTKWNKTPAENKNASVIAAADGETSGPPPGMASGGTVLGSGRVLVGERGPEILDLPVGARVMPLPTGASTQTLIDYDRLGRALADAMMGVRVEGDFVVDVDRGIGRLRQARLAL